MKVINLFGQPSAGKSTTAAGVFHELKKRGINCELVTEYAKDMVWKDMPSHAFKDQIYITAKQNHRQERLRGKVDYVITDSPLLLGLIYMPEDYYEGYEELVWSIFHSYNNLNFFLERKKEYNPVGRNQTEEESNKIGAQTKEFLQKNDLPFFNISCSIDETVNKVLNHIDINQKLIEICEEGS